jgi:hypothetical protein
MPIPLSIPCRRAAWAILLLGSLGLAPRPAVAQVHVAFDPADGFITMAIEDDECVPSDDTLSVAITVDDAALDLKGFSLVFELDPLVVAAVSVAPGSLLVDGGCADHFFAHLNAGAPGDSVAVDAAWLGCATAGPGDLAEIRFVGLQHGVSPLTWRSITLRDSQNADVAAVGDDGQIRVTCPTSVGRTTWGRMRAVYRAP